MLAIQVKHKQPGALNEGWLQNDWVDRDPAFDYLVFFVPERSRGLVIPRHKLKKRGKVFIFYAKDLDGYPRGAVRPCFGDYAFELSDVEPDVRS